MSIVYAHRGASRELPENTLQSFRRALELGADAIESDAHATADGHVVLSHDETGKRMAGVDKAIAVSSLSDVQRWDVGWGFRDADGGRPFVGKGFRIPTLEEVLQEFPSVRFNIDVKQARPSIVGAVVGLLRKLGAESRVLLTSFDQGTLDAIRRLGYAGETGLSRGDIARLVFLPTAALRAAPLKGSRAQVPDRLGRFDLAAPAVIAKCHALGLGVDYWTVNDPERAKLLLQRGADGIMTDDPALLVPAVRAFEREFGAREKQTTLTSEEYER